MSELLLQLLPATAEDFAKLRSDVTRKVLATDIAGDEKRVADTPGDDQAHNALGVGYFQMGRVNEGLAQVPGGGEAGAQECLVAFQHRVD